jgi:hypothetical protein
MGRNTNDKTYVQDENGVVYKKMPDYMLKLSPWENGEDRRVVEQDIGKGYKMITYQNACFIVNAQFRGKTEKWEHDGKKYVASSIENKDPNEHYHMLSILPDHKKFISHMSKYMIDDKIADGTTMTYEVPNDYEMKFKMVKYHGKVYYIFMCDTYLPRVQAYDLFGRFAQWVGIKDCKPIFCETDNKYI